MKKLLLISLVLIIGCATAQFTDLQNSEEFATRGTKLQNYQKSLQWIASTFGSAKAVIEYKDPVEGKIIGNIITETSTFGTSFKFKTLMTISVENKKAKISFLAKKLSKSGTPFQEIYASEAEFAQKSYIPIIDSYKNFIK